MYKLELPKSAKSGPFASNGWFVKLYENQIYASLNERYKVG